jgi:hypothetical protein
MDRVDNQPGACEALHLVILLSKGKAGPTLLLA